MTHLVVTCPCCGAEVAYKLTTSEGDILRQSYNKDLGVSSTEAEEDSPVVPPLVDGGAVVGLANIFGWHSEQAKNMARRLWGNSAKLLTSPDSPHPSQVAALWTGRALRRAPKLEHMERVLTDMEHPRNIYNGKPTEPDDELSWNSVLGYI